MPRELNIPPGMTLDSLLIGPGHPEDFERLNLAAFDRLADTHNADDLRWLNDWIAPQETVNLILQKHGRPGLVRVLKGIAQASSQKKVHMSDRIASIAGFYEYTVY